MNFKVQSHCANMTFSDKIRYVRILQQVTHIGGDSKINYSKRLKNAQVMSVLVGKN